LTPDIPTARFQGNEKLDFLLAIHLIPSFNNQFLACLGHGS